MTDALKVTGIVVNEAKLMQAMATAGVTATEDAEGVTFVSDAGEVRLNEADVSAALETAESAQAFMVTMGVPQETASMFAQACEMFGLLEPVQDVPGLAGGDGESSLQFDDGSE
jgi:hypothetical protein